MTEELLVGQVVEEIPISPSYQQLDMVDRSYEFNLQPLRAAPLLYGRITALKAPFSIATVACIGLLVLGIVLMVNLAQGTISLSGSASPWWHDFIHWAFGTSVRIHPQITPAVPLLRDYASLSLIVAIAASIPLVYFLYSELGVLYGSLHTNGCFVVLDKVRLKTHFDRFNRSLDHSRERTRYTVLCCLALVVAIYWAASSPQTFSSWAPSAAKDIDRSGWIRTASVHWWAHPWSGRILWIVIGTLGLYSFAVQSFVGWRWMLYLVRTSDFVEYKPNPADPDGHFGWHRLRKIIGGILFGSIPLAVLGGFGLYGIFKARFGEAAGVAVFLGLVMNITVMMSCFVKALRNNIRRARRAQIIQLTTALEGEELKMLGEGRYNTASIAAREELRAEVSRLASMPTFPFRPPAVLASFAIVGIPVVAGVVDLISVLAKG